MISTFLSLLRLHAITVHSGGFGTSFVHILYRNPVGRAQKFDETFRMSSEETKRSVVPENQALQSPRPQKQRTASTGDKDAVARRQQKPGSGIKSSLDNSSLKNDRAKISTQLPRKSRTTALGNQVAPRSQQRRENPNPNLQTSSQASSHAPSEAPSQAPFQAPPQASSQATSQAPSQAPSQPPSQPPPQPPSQPPSQATSQGLKRSFPTEDDRNESPRPRKRPGGAARVSAVEKEAVLKRQQDREAEARREAESRGVHDVVRQHYNAVPQRGRDWRKTESRIKGLRSFNNWVKSVIIHKFSPADAGNGPPLRVLDLGCGKGGDLGKWQQAPQSVEVYVGIDPAEVSLDQARERHAEMQHKGSRGGRGGRAQQMFDAVFIAQDAFGHTIANIPVVRNIGFDPSAPNQRRGGGGFDVVSMMFCMHYAFESEAKTREMLQNVAGSLKKGGRFIGTIPNSDIIRSRVEGFHKAQAEHERADKNSVSETSLVVKSGNSNSAAQATAAKELNGQSPPTNKQFKDAAGDISASTAIVSSQTNITVQPQNGPRINPSTNPSTKNAVEAVKRPVAEWGNEIYHVRFHGSTPKDGVFRPPFGWRYSFFLEEAVEEIPEYVVPWEAFRA